MGQFPSSLAAHPHTNEVEVTQRAAKFFIEGANDKKVSLCFFKIWFLISGFLLFVLFLIIF